MKKAIIRRFIVDGEEYEDYDGEEVVEAPDEEWDMFNDSFNW